MTFPFPKNVPPSGNKALGFSAPKPMQWPDGAIADEDDWEFYPEAIKSWRAWRVVSHSTTINEVLAGNGVIMLQSITYPTVWTPKQEMIAECRPMSVAREGSITKPHTHSCPDLTHGCGIYSVKTEEQALEWKKYRSQDPVVWGQVNIWGHVYKFTKGYLSEFAYPSRIFVPFNLASWSELITPEMLACEISETYGIEAVTL